MSKPSTHQYTIRNVPEQVDSVLRQRAQALGKSLNQVVLDALFLATNSELPIRDLSDIVGSMSREEVLLMDREIQQQRQVEPDLWR